MLVFSDRRDESHNRSVRDGSLRAGDRQRTSPEASGRGERGDSDVPLQVARPGAVHAEEQADLEAGGDPARDRLHLRPAVGPGEPPRGGAVRGGGGVGACVRLTPQAAPPAPGPPARAQHHPPRRQARRSAPLQPHGELMTLKHRLDII